MCSRTLPLLANNAVIDSYGRVGARKGFSTLSDADAADVIYCVHEHINKDGTEQIYFVGGNQIYTMAVDGTAASVHTMPHRLMIQTGNP